MNYRSSSPEFRKKESKGERENEEEQDEGKSVESFEARTASVYSYRGNGRAKTGESEGTNKETYFSKHKPEGRGNEEI